MIASPGFGINKKAAFQRLGIDKNPAPDVDIFDSILIGEYTENEVKKDYPGKWHLLHEQ